MEAIVTLAIWAACGYVCMQIAEKKGRSSTNWLIFGILGGLIAVLIIAFLPPI